MLASSKLLAVRTTMKRSPRMVKRKNSPYKSHDRKAKTRVPAEATPTPLARRPLTARQKPPRAKAKTQSRTCRTVDLN